MSGPPTTIADLDPITDYCTLDMLRIFDPVLIVMVEGKSYRITIKELMEAMA